MPLSDFLKSHQYWRREGTVATVASVKNDSHTSPSPQTQQSSGLPATVASVARVECLEKKFVVSTSIINSTQSESKNSIQSQNDIKYIKSKKELYEEQNDPKTNTQKAATLQHLCGIAGKASCDTSATVATVEFPVIRDDEVETPIQCLQRQIESAWTTRTPSSFDVPEGYDSETLCRGISHQLDKWWDEEPGTQLMGVMVLPAFPDQPERICLYRLSLGECDPPSVMDDSSMLLQILVRWAEFCPIDAEWLIPPEYLHKSKGLERMADNVARATGRDRRVKLMQDRLRCVPWGYDE